MGVRTAILQHAIFISVMRASGSWWQSSERLKSNRQFPSLMHARPDHGCQTSGRSYLNCDSCLTETRVRTGYYIVRTDDWSSLSWNLERNQKLIEYWEASGDAAETSGRMQAGTETSRYSMGSGQNEHFVRTDDAGLSSVRTGWHVVWTDGSVDR